MRKAYINGVVYTMKEENDVCSAFVVEDGKFIYCGNDGEAEAIADGEIVDLKGKTVLPGFIDTHQHVLAYSRDLHKLNLKDVRSLEELKERIREKAATLKNQHFTPKVNMFYDKYNHFSHHRI